MQLKTLILLLIIWTTGIAALGQDQDKPAYRIFSKEGKEVGYTKMLRGIRMGDVIFFGELHDNPIAHWLELEITKDLYQEQPVLTLGMEMFEADDQLVVDEYLQGLIQEKHLLNEAKVWPNYTADYKPLVEFARAKGLAVIATNVPRRYANLVYREGLEALDSLAAEAKEWIAPLPLVVDPELPGYRKMISEMGDHIKPEKALNLVYAQAIKDATMAYFINQHTKGGRILHINGAYHSRDGEGIIWYLREINPQLRIRTIETVEQEYVDQLQEENREVADFIIAIPKSMPKSHSNR